MLYSFVCMLVAFAVPAVLHAQGAPQNFGELVGFLVGFIQILIVAVFSLTFLVLVWTIIKTWIISSGDEAEVAKGKQVLTTGIIALVIMSGVWGIVALLRAGLFGL